MHRPGRPGLVAILLLLLLLAAAYGGFWYWAAEWTRAALQGWAQARRSEGFTIGWDRYAIAGFPLELRVSIEKPVFGKVGAAPGYEVRAPSLVAWARPWALERWRFSASAGARLAIEPGPLRPPVRVQAASIDGAVAPREDGVAGGLGRALTLTADEIAIDTGALIGVKHADLQAVLPQHGVASHLDIWISATVGASGITLPASVPPLGATIDRLAAQLAVKGTIPPGPRRQALEAWRNDGGTVEIEDFMLAWGNLGLEAKGTLALDEALQPQAALGARIRGYSDIIDALVGAGTLRPGDGAVAKIGLGLLAKAGADGTPQIETPLTVQNGQLFMGPARVAKLPVFTWE